MGRLLRCFCVFVFVAATACATSECPSLLKKAGASEKFAERVVHAIHAITVSDLKKFEPKATEKNQVPTVNRDKTSTFLVLPNAPDIKSVDEDRFTTATMKLLDLILSHIDDRMYYESDYTLIEQIIHTAHMQDHRMEVKVHYDKLKKTRLSNDTELCGCVLDTRSNGILDILIVAAKYAHDHSQKISNIDQGTLRYSRLDSHTNYACKGGGGCQQTTVVKSPNPDDCSAPVGASALNLAGSEAWSLYKKRLHCLETHTYDAALFLYCALKQI